MNNAQLYIGLVFFFVGSLWFIVTVLGARVERLDQLQAGRNLALAADRDAAADRRTDRNADRRTDRNADCRTDRNADASADRYGYADSAA